MEIGVQEAKTNLSKLIEATLGGETVVITRRGVPAVALTPIATSRTSAGFAETKPTPFTHDAPAPPAKRAEDMAEEELDAALRARGYGMFKGLASIPDDAGRRETDEELVELYGHEAIFGEQREPR